MLYKQSTRANAAAAAATYFWFLFNCSLVHSYSSLGRVYSLYITNTLYI